MTDGPSDDGTNEDDAGEGTTEPDRTVDGGPETVPVGAGDTAEHGAAESSDTDEDEAAQSGDPAEDEAVEPGAADDPDRSGRIDTEEPAGMDPAAGDAGRGRAPADERDDEDGTEPVDSAVNDQATVESDDPATGTGESAAESDVPADVRTYDRFKKIDGGTYDRANEFLRDRTYITAREWAIARLCADFRTETGVEMTKIGENLPQLVPFMTDTYTPQAVNQARASFEQKVRKSGATFLYGAMCDFFTAQELDDVMYEATEVAKFLLEVEGVELSVDDELEAEDRISEVMREVREHSAALRHEEMTCPECGHEMSVEE